MNFSEQRAFKLRLPLSNFKKNKTIRVARLLTMFGLFIQQSGNPENNRHSENS
jgi:hypothetical protein